MELYECQFCLWLLLLVRETIHPCPSDVRVTRVSALEGVASGRGDSLLVPSELGPVVVGNV